MNPENQPTPLTALFAAETPPELHYRRNHFLYPEIDCAGWSLLIGGLVEEPLRLDLPALQRLPARELTVLLECAGHRRREYDPPISGVPWKTGALGQARWRGASLADVLRLAGVLPAAVEIVLYGADCGQFAGEPGTHSFARSLPLEKALHPDTLLAWEMNGEPLPDRHGAPVRAVVPGWYAMDSVKWLTRIQVSGEPFRGPFQEKDYRFLAEDETGIGERLTQIPVSSLILFPLKWQSVAAGTVTIRGIAWGGSGGVAQVELRVDDGPWAPARLGPSEGKYGKSPWEAQITLTPGKHDLAVRATDGSGIAQPERAEWNRRGYANNGIHQVPVRAE